MTTFPVPRRGSRSDLAGTPGGVAESRDEIAALSAGSGRLASRSAGGAIPGATGTPNTVPGDAGVSPWTPASPLPLATP